MVDWASSTPTDSSEKLIRKCHISFLVFDVEAGIIVSQIALWEV